MSFSCLMHDEFVVMFTHVEFVAAHVGDKFSWNIQINAISFYC